MYAAKKYYCYAQQCHRSIWGVLRCGVIMIYDIIVIGGGPAGLTAAIYARRAKKTVLVCEKEGFGGQVTHSPKIENYPGFPEISGAALADAMLEQATALGADIEVDTVTGIKDGKIKTVVTEYGEFQCRAVIIAVGVKHRTLGVYGEEEFEGNGVSYCAVCDGAFYTGKRVAVVGGGNSGLQEAVMLSQLCKSVVILQDLPMLTGEASLVSIVSNKENVSVITGAKVLGFEGKDEFTGVKIECGGVQSTVECDGAFVAIGLKPDNGFAADVAGLDRSGYFDSDEGCATFSDGIFVAGDCRAKRIRQITTATADGATAALAACRYIERI